MRFVFSILFLLSQFILNAQSIEDSLLVELKNTQNDSVKISLLNEIAFQLCSSKPFESEQYAEQALEISKKTNNEIGLAKSLKSIGLIAYTRSDYSTALKHFFDALMIYEKIGNKKSLAGLYNNIGLVYTGKFDYTKSIFYHKKSLAIKLELNDEIAIAASYNNIGSVFSQLQNIDSSEFYHHKALKIRTKNNDKKGMATSYYNLANNSFDKGKYEQALDNHFKALTIFQELNEVFNTSYTNAEIANNYIMLKKYDEAKKHADLALSIAVKYQLKEAEMESYSALYKLYAKLNNPQLELNFYRKYVGIKDSIKSETNAAEIAKLETEFEYKKKIEAQKTEQQRKDEIQKIESKRQKTFIVLVCIVLILVIIFSYYLFSRLKLIRKQKAVIEQQKHLVDEKQKEILDSITYAKRLQQAILPPDSLIKKHLPNSFVLYKPKDIVAGDFYWMEANANIVMFAAADCTGHGVPGAMVSVVCSNALNRTVKEFGLTEPGKILDKVRELVIETFEKSESEVKDGMDISLCVLDKQTKKLQWSGANNPLWLVRNNELLETKADKQPIGKYADLNSFTTHNIELQQNDVLYIFTDGYADQFGGEQGKKFKGSKMKELILFIQNRTMNAQKDIINQSFEDWRGSLEQVDDVCVVGIKI